MAFATVDDLVQRWPDIPDDRLSIAEVRLDDAAAMIVAQCGDVSNVDEAILRMVSCDMVGRILSRSDNLGATAVDLQAGPFAQRVQFEKPTGGMYISAQERKSIKTAGRGAFQIDLIPSSSTFWVAP